MKEETILKWKIQLKMLSSCLETLNKQYEGGGKFILILGDT